MQKRGEEECAGRMEQVRGDLWQRDSSKTEIESLQDGSKTCYDVWFGDGTDKKTGGGAAGSRIEEVHIGTNQDGQNSR